MTDIDDDSRCTFLLCLLVSFMLGPLSSLIVCFCETSRQMKYGIGLGCNISTIVYSGGAYMLYHGNILYNVANAGLILFSIIFIIVISRKYYIYNKNKINKPFGIVSNQINDPSKTIDSGLNSTDLIQKDLNQKDLNPSGLNVSSLDITPSESISDYRSKYYQSIDV